MDEDKELAEIRRKKLEAIQQQQTGDEQEQAAQEQYDQQRQAALRKIMTADARERLARLRIARPELAENIENQLIMLAQSGQLNTAIDDAALVQLLEKLTPQKREITIKRI